MYTLNLNNVLVKGRMSDIFNVINQKHGKDAKVIALGKYEMKWAIHSRETGLEIGTIEYTDKGSDPIRRSSLRTETFNRKN